MTAVFAAFAAFFPPGGCKSNTIYCQELEWWFFFRGNIFNLWHVLGTALYKRVNHTLGAFFSSGGLVVSRVMRRVFASKIILEPQLHAKSTVMRIIHDITLKLSSNCVTTTNNCKFILSIIDIYRLESDFNQTYTDLIF